MHLKTPDGQSAVVVGGSVPADHDGWMWDLTIPGNSDHDFYVDTAAAPVLVHNCGAGRDLIGEERSGHILDGHAFPGAEGKDPFPEHWSNDDILDAVADVVTSPESQRVWKTGSAKWAPITGLTRLGDPAVQAITGTVNGVSIEVRFEPLTDTILTAFPVG